MRVPDPPPPHHRVFFAPRSCRNVHRVLCAVIRFHRRRYRAKQKPFKVDPIITHGQSRVKTKREMTLFPSSPCVRRRKREKGRKRQTKDKSDHGVFLFPVCRVHVRRRLRECHSYRQSVSSSSARPSAVSMAAVVQGQEPLLTRDFPQGKKGPKERERDTKRERVRKKLFCTSLGSSTTGSFHPCR